jgi:HEAT repeat protein
MAAGDDADEELDLAALSVPALVALARDADEDDDRNWIFVRELQRRGDAETFAAAERLIRSDDPDERILGADVLGQIGYMHARVEPYTGIRRQAVSRLRELLVEDEDTEVIQAAVSGLGNLGGRSALHDVVTFAMHPDPELRGTVASAFPGLTGWGEDLAELDADDARLAIGTLIALSDDEDGDVRNWALFALARQYEIDTPQLRELFLRHLDDLHDDAREEAMVGLARRRDGRAFDAVRDALDPDAATRVAIEAAAHLGDERLIERLEELAEAGWSDDDTLQAAIRTCDPGQRTYWAMVGEALAAILEGELIARVGDGAPVKVEAGRAALEYEFRLQAAWTTPDGLEHGLSLDVPSLVDERIDGDLERAAGLLRDAIARAEGPR